MRLISIALSFLLCSCISVPVDMIRTDGAIGRQLERVLSRHDAYVGGDVLLEEGVRAEELAESDAVRSLCILGEVRRAALGAAFAPVSARHDWYVLNDLTLEELAVDTYLASSEQLRRLLGQGGE